MVRQIRRGVTGAVSDQSDRSGAGHDPAAGLDRRYGDPELWDPGVAETGAATGAGACRANGWASAVEMELLARRYLNRRIITGLTIDC